MKVLTTSMLGWMKIGTQEASNPVGRGRYQCLVGKLIYLSHTRPDIAFIVSRVSQYMHAPIEEHMEAVYRILKYLKGTLGLGLFFGKNGERSIEAYKDADWAGAIDDRKSTSRYFTFVWGNLVTWRSKKQTIVARSTAEAGLRSVAHGICEVLWLKILLEELEVMVKLPLRIYCDNNVAINISHNPVHHDRTKHVEIDKHFIKEKIEDDVSLVASTIMYAFYLNETRKIGQFCTVPVINMKRADLSSHAEIKWLLNSCQIDQSSLIFLDEIDLSYYDLFGGLKLVLLNGDRLPTKQEAFKEAVVEIFGCKKDSEYPWVETVTAGQDCSCCTLIAENFALYSPEILAGKGFSRLLRARRAAGGRILEGRCLQCWWSPRRIQSKKEGNREEKVPHKVSWVPYIGLLRKWSVVKDQEKATVFLSGDGRAQWCVNALRIGLIGLKLAEWWREN
uniref:Retrovirus-related Pol polyprotein from transposon RE1 n=1 Tax=Vitis vinifera TaxID=29760 RepID=A5BS64_VITVI|nr:hypothetical protein VITISV_014045 [Vitis vinifera]